LIFVVVDLYTPCHGTIVGCLLHTDRAVPMLTERLLSCSAPGTFA
jgi:hypothetical protein